MCDAESTHGVRSYAHRDAARSSRLPRTACVRLTRTRRTYKTEKLLRGTPLEDLNIASAYWKLRGAS